MPNQRRKGQTFIGFQGDAALVRLLDSARRHDPRSLFIRQAVAEKLQSMGFTVTDDLVYAPDRADRLAESDPAEVPAVQKERQKVTYKVPKKPRKSPSR